MKRLKTLRTAILVSLMSVTSGSIAQTITLTNTTVIGIHDTNYEGQAIVVTNCVVTIDGRHAFLDLQILKGGMLTHSFSANGLLENRLSISGEPHALSLTNPATLGQTNVITNSIVVTDTTGSLVYTQGVDYGLLLTTNSSVQLSLLSGSAIPEGATVLVSYDFLGQTVSAGLYLTISNNLVVESGGAIVADGRGFDAGAGPGAGMSRSTNWPYIYTSGAGGGHGGFGGSSRSLALGGNCYDATLQPTNLGSGGGPGMGMEPGGTGGGLIQLVVGRVMRVDGMISANGVGGTNPASGGGSGGGIWLSARSVSGGGSLAADGGAGEPAYGGGGGGGQIAIWSATNQFAGSYSAKGGWGSGSGGAGTIYLTTGDLMSGQVLLDNGGARGTNTLLSISGGFDLTVGGGAVAQMASTQHKLSTLQVRSNGWVTGPYTLANLALGVSGDVVIDAGGGVVADGKAPPGGPGAGRASAIGGGGGGGHGGYGGLGSTNGAGGSTYGSLLQPTESGSSGGSAVFLSLGGTGGGALQITTLGTLTVDGRISADGNPGTAPRSGGGSGGSVWLSVGTLSGTGAISANGGSGELPFGGGGGGGRISINYVTNKFTGSVSARGAAGWSAGPNPGLAGAGTICFQARVNSPAQVIIDNGGTSATNTPLAAVGSMDLTVSGGAIADMAGLSQLSLLSLRIGSNSWLVGSSPGTYVRTLQVASDVVIEAGGGIKLDGEGNPEGPGTPRLFGGGGGGYGGFGGNGLTNAPGGASYGSPGAPLEPGSGGGGSRLQESTSAGGAALRLIVYGQLVLDGRISANGNRGTIGGGGGGSGGAVWFTALRFAGAGTISVDGGAGDSPSGGGGGGGRIAIYCNTNQFVGRLSARGGAGANYGGAGTIYQTLNQSSFAQIAVDNGGQPATNTPFSLSPGHTYDLSVGGGAQALLIISSATGSAVLSNLMVMSNSWLIVSNGVRVPFNVWGDATIESEGGLVLDGKGYPGAQGPGAGRTLGILNLLTGSGGGYGGYGGSSGAGALGGNSYGSINMPQDLGSGGGGTTFQPPFGGAGGGMLQLNVHGTLTVDGRLSADGSPRLASGAGGGSGGSLWLAVTNLAGSGSISANGGAGDAYGGGGGGGRIAIYAGQNDFTGVISAHGGVGAKTGGAGTIYIAPAGAGAGRVFVDNGGVVGTNTPIGYVQFLDLLSVSGGAIAALGGMNVNSLVLKSNGWLSAFNPPAAIQLGVLGDALIEAGSGIVVDGQGYPSESGPGHGATSSANPLTGGGGGYGGCGGMSTPTVLGGNAYGSLLLPMNLGSGGGLGGAGGGAVSLVVDGNLQLDGSITAEGMNATMEGGGGGSGGSILVQVGKLSGGGLMSADGGSGDYPQGGGGGGGRIAVHCGTNEFSGAMSALGGFGAVPGGAGTIYFRSSAEAVGRLVVDNGGALGTNTPIDTAESFDLIASGGAVVQSSGDPLVVASLRVDSGARLTHLSTQSNLDLTVLANALVSSNSAIVADGSGYNGYLAGPGAGTMPAGSGGSGGGYGGMGGASAAGTPGGTNYGSAQEPVDQGSRGGLNPITAGFCQGGGAVRLRVGGTLDLEGALSANGNDALFESAGGGSGGSIWVTAGELIGTGTITANGGAGELFEGGGGGGGRIALYSGASGFSGTIAAPGGFGASPGGNGTVYASSLPTPNVIAQTPAGEVSFVVSGVDLTLDQYVVLGPGAAAGVVLETPNGPLTPSSVSTPSLSTLHLEFLAQTSLGYYEVRLSAPLTDLYGTPVNYVGSFVIVPPVISGQVTDEQGVPVSFVTLNPGGSMLPTLTDGAGLFSIAVPPSWSGTLTPSKDSQLFIPASRSYTNLSASLTHQDFVSVSPTNLTMTTVQQGGTLHLTWYGIGGVTYQMFYSSDMVRWIPYGQPFPGTNGPVNLSVASDAAPAEFFRFGTVLGPGL